MLRTMELRLQELEPRRVKMWIKEETEITE